MFFVVCPAVQYATPVCIIVFGVVTTDGDVLPSFVFPLGLTLNKETYIKCLADVVLTWIDTWLLEDPMSDNRTTIHGIQNRWTQCWLPENFCDHITPKIWSFNSQDYYIWGVVERETNKTLCYTKDGSLLIGWLLVVSVSWHINLCRLFNDKSILLK